MSAKHTQINILRAWTRSNNLIAMQHDFFLMNKNIQTIYCYKGCHVRMKVKQTKTRYLLTQKSYRRLKAGLTRV